MLFFAAACLYVPASILAAFLAFLQALDSLGALLDVEVVVDDVEGTGDAALDDSWIIGSITF